MLSAAIDRGAWIGPLRRAGVDHQGMAFVAYLEKAQQRPEAKRDEEERFHLPAIRLRRPRRPLCSS